MVRSPSFVGGANSSTPTPRPERVAPVRDHPRAAITAITAITGIAAFADDASGVDPKDFAIQFFFNDGASGVKEGHAISFKGLKDKTFSAKETGSNFSIQGNVYFGTQGRA